MNAWLISATVLLFTLVPAGIIAFRGDPMDRIVGFERMPGGSVDVGEVDIGVKRPG